MPGPLYLLDTNILVHSIRSDPLGQQIRTEYDLLMTGSRPLICVVSDGELRSLAAQWNWGTARSEQTLFLLSYFVRIGIDEGDILNAYALIDTYSRRAGVAMGKNDLWIAAAAHVAGATLLTTDADFDHLASVFFPLSRVEGDQVNRRRP